MFKKMVKKKRKEKEKCEVTEKHVDKWQIKVLN